MRTRPTRRRAILAAAAAASLLIAGCTGGDRLAEEYRDGLGGNYISGDGSLIVLDPEDRDEPVEYAGLLDTGGEFSSADIAGKVTVVNFWYAACPPCRVEAPDLVGLHAALPEDEVAFIGVNVRDAAGASLTFAREFGIEYPSILDQADNAVQLAFAGQVPPNAVPTTLITDTEGRVAARFSGIISSPSLVTTIVNDLLAETASAAGAS